MPSLQSASFGNLRVVLVTPRNPLNIGAVARAMSNFGFSRLRVVNPYDPAFREARSAMGASELLARAEEFAAVADAVADCTLVVGTTAIGNRVPPQPVRTLVPAAALLRKRLRSSGVALLFGSEKWGLSNDALSHCHWLLHIPTREGHRSMNLGQAVAVCLYEIARAGALSNLAKKPPSAKSETVERITGKLLDALHASGYVKPRVEASAEEKLRRLVRRLHLEAADAEVLLGMIHKILWKLRSGS